MEKIKENDVFRFSWSPKKEQGWDSRQHCFEGYLVARKKYGSKTEIELRDTYWGIGGDGQVLTLEEIKKNVKDGGKFTFYFNLNDYEKIDEPETHYFDETDIAAISEQHACIPRCIFHYKKKDAKRSKARMLNEINEKIREERRNIEYAVSELERLSERRTKIETGDLNQYL